MAYEKESAYKYPIRQKDREKLEHLLQDEARRLIRDRQDYHSTRTARTGSVYSTFNIPPPPENLCVQYIGGPRNSSQDFYPAKTFSYIKNGETFKTNITRLITHPPGSGLSPEYVVDSFSYRAVFVPVADTPFLQDHQLVIALFQGQA